MQFEVLAKFFKNHHNLFNFSTTELFCFSPIVSDLVTKSVLDVPVEQVVADVGGGLLHPLDGDGPFV